MINAPDHFENLPQFVPMQNLNVLVVEDEPADFALIERLLGRLEGFNVEVTLAPDLSTAQAAAERDGFDAALIDFYVSGRCGLDIVPQLLATSQKCAPILLTGQLTRPVHLHALQAGVVASLSKDRLEPRQLETVIRHALQNRFLMARLLACLDELSDLRNHKLDQTAKLTSLVANYLAPLVNCADGVGRSLMAKQDTKQDTMRLAMHIRALSQLTDDLRKYCRETSTEFEQLRHTGAAAERIDLQAMVIEALRLVDDHRKHRAIDVRLAALDHPVHIRANEGPVLRALIDLLTACLMHVASNGRLDIKVSVDASDARVAIGSAHFISRPDNMRLGGALRIARCRALLDRYQGELEILSMPGGQRHIALLRLPRVSTEGHRAS